MLAAGWQQRVKLFRIERRLTMLYLIGALTSIALAFFVFGNISEKAGYPRWYGLLTAVPFLNVILTILFAYSTWPIEQQILESRFAQATPTNQNVAS
jgi:uncharacterized membrane protein YhdT